MKLDFIKILEENNLKVGDRVRLDYINSAVYKIAVENNCLLLKNVKTNMTVNIQFLQYGFEKLEPKKKVGDLRCGEINCPLCPLKCLDCGCGCGSPLREIFELTLKEYPQLELMKEYLEQELDKEGEEE